MAAAGFTGPTDLFDNAKLYDRSKLLSDLGTCWPLEGIYFKPYSCCRWAHAAIDAVLSLKDQYAFAPDDIGSISIQTFGWALRLNNETAPLTLESAQYSIPFWVALAATRGAAPLVQLSEDALSDDEAIALAERVTLSVDPRFDEMFPDAVPVRVIVETVNGRFENIVTAPLGEPTNPLDWSALEAKLESVTSSALSKHRQETLTKAINRMALDGALAPLIDALAEPLTYRSTAVV